MSSNGPKFIKFSELNQDNDIFLNTACLGIQFLLDGKLYYSSCIETAFYGIQGYIPYKGNHENDNSESTATRIEAQQLIENETTVSNSTQARMQENVPDFFHLPIEPTELNYFYLPVWLTMTVKDQLIYELLLIKATQHIGLLKTLMETGDDILWHSNSESNALGKMWMRVRETLKNELYQTQKIRVRRELSNTLLCYYLGLDIIKNSHQEQTTPQYIEQLELDNTPSFLKVEQIYAHFYSRQLSFLTQIKAEMAPNANEFPLHVAVYQGNLEEVKKLLALGCAADELDKGGVLTDEKLASTDPKLKHYIRQVPVNGRTPLYLACLRASGLLEGSPYIDCTVSEQPTPNAWTDIIQFLLAHQANPLAMIDDENYPTAIHLVIVNGNYRLLKYFREFNGSSEKSYMREFLERYGCHIRDRFDCETVCYPDTKQSIFLSGYPLLFQAAQHGDLVMIQDIFNYAKEFTINASQDTFFCKDKKELIQHYLNNTGSDHPYEAALHAAARGGNLEIVKLFVEYGADVSIETRHGQTAADIAKAFGHEQVYSYLMGFQNLNRVG